MSTNVNKAITNGQEVCVSVTRIINNNGDLVGVISHMGKVVKELGIEITLINPKKIATFGPFVGILVKQGRIMIAMGSKGNVLLKRITRTTIKLF